MARTSALLACRRPRRHDDAGIAAASRCHILRREDDVVAVDCRRADRRHLHLDGVVAGAAVELPGDISISTSTTLSPEQPTSCPVTSLPPRCCRQGCRRAVRHNIHCDGLSPGRPASCPVTSRLHNVVDRAAGDQSGVIFTLTVVATRVAGEQPGSISASTMMARPSAYIRAIPIYTGDLGGAAGMQLSAIFIAATTRMPARRPTSAPPHRQAWRGCRRAVRRHGRHER